MKGEAPHRVPLSSRAQEIIDEMRKLEEPYVFPGAAKGEPLSDAAMAQQLNGMRQGVTVHGFRSTFRDYTSEHTSVPREISEMALAHAIESKTEAAYRRGDLFMKRLDLMETWAKYCGGEFGQDSSAR